MISDLVGWFVSRDENKRRFPRKVRPYDARCGPGQAAKVFPATGVDISGGGLCVVCPDKPVDEFSIELALEGRPIRARLKLIWAKPDSYNGRPGYRCGTRFLGISADDWDAVVRYCNDQETIEAESKAVQDIVQVRMSAEEQDRLLPKQLRDRMLAELVKRGRVIIPPKGEPLVRYYYSGVSKRGTLAMHNLVIESRMMVGKNGPQTFKTRFRFTDSGHIEVVEKP